MELTSRDLNDFLYDDLYYAGIKVEEILSTVRFANWVLKEVYKFDAREQDEYWEMATECFQDNLCYVSQYVSQRENVSITDVFVSEHIYALGYFLTDKLGLNDNDIDFDVYYGDVTFVIGDRDLVEEFGNLDRKGV